MNIFLTFAISFAIGFGMSAIMDTYFHDTYKYGVRFIKSNFH